MVDARSRNPADLIKHYTDLITQERVKLDECLAAISEYAGQLKRIADDTQQRLLSRS